MGLELMATCDTSELMASSNCFSCLEPYQLQLINTSLLCQILQAYTPMASCDVSALLASSNCFACLQPAQLLWLQTQLLCEILAVAGGGAGGGAVTCGLVNPVAAPTTTCGIYYRTDTGSIWLWDGAAWQQKIV